MERQLRPRKKADASDTTSAKETKTTRVKKTITPVKKVSKKSVTATKGTKVNKCNVTARQSLRGKSSPEAAADSGNQSIKRFMTTSRDEVQKQIEKRRAELKKKKSRGNELEHVFSFEDTEEDVGKLKKTRKKVAKKKPSKDEDKEGDLLTMVQVRDLLHMNNNNADKDVTSKPRKFFKTPIEDMKWVVKKEVLWNYNNNAKTKKRAVKSTKTTRPRDKASVKKPKVTKVDEEDKVDETAAEENEVDENKSAATVAKQVNFNQNDNERNETEVDPVDEAVEPKPCGPAVKVVSDEILSENDRISLLRQRKTAALSVNPFRKTAVFQKRLPQPQEPSPQSPMISSNQNSVESRTRAPLGENRTIQNTISPLKTADLSWDSKSPEIKFTQQRSIVMSTPHMPNFKSDVISKVNEDVRCGRPPLLAIQRENEILPVKEGTKKSAVGSLDDVVATKTHGAGVQVVSDEILSKNDRISLHRPRKTAALSVNPFRKTTIFPKRLAPPSPQSPRISLNSNSMTDQSPDEKSPEIKFTQQHSIVMSTPHVPNFKSDVIAKVNEDVRCGRPPLLTIQNDNKILPVKDAATPLKCHLEPVTEPESQFLENGFDNSRSFGGHLSFGDNRRNENEVLQSSRKHSDDETIYEENVEPLSMANRITVEAVIEAPPRSREEATSHVQRPPLRARNDQMICEENIEPLSMANKITVEAVIEAPPRSKEEVTNVIVQRTPLKSLHNSNVPNRKAPAVALSNEVLDEISVADVAVDVPRSKVEDKIRASLFNVDNAFGFDFNQNEPVKKPANKMRQPKLMEVAPNFRYLNNLKHTHSPTVRYLVKEIESIITTKKTKNTSKNKTEDAECQTDESSSFNCSGDQSTTLNTKEWSNTFDIDSYEQENKTEDQILLFEDAYEPVHFKEPVKYSYSRKRKISFEDEETDEEEYAEKESKKVKYKKRKATKAAKESPEELEWMQKINKTFEEVDTFDLCVE